MVKGKQIKMYHRENLQLPSYKKFHFEQVFSLKYCKKTPTPTTSLPGFIVFLRRRH